MGFEPGYAESLWVYPRSTSRSSARGNARVKACGAARVVMFCDSSCCDWMDSIADVTIKVAVQPST